MLDRINGGSPVVRPQQYHTVPTAVIAAAQQRDRYLNQSEAKELLAFFGSGQRRLDIAQTLTQHATPIVAVGAKRIFVGGNPMVYLEQPKAPVGLPGSDYYVAEDYLSAAVRERQNRGDARSRPRDISSPERPMDWLKGIFTAGRPSVPSRFSAIDISRYGTARMKRSMRDLSWFLRYVTYAIVAGDTTIISVNTKGLRGVIPEDVTLATIVALREMQWKALTYFPSDSPAAALVRRYFDVLIDDYSVEKPPSQLRTGVSKHHQGLRLPQSYSDSATAQPRWIMKTTLSDIEKDEVIRAAYRQVFERDITHPYGASMTELTSQVKSGLWSMREFVRQLGRSRLYRQLFYEPYTISRSIELACRHFLGRGLSCMEEFQTYFEMIAADGFGAVVDALVDSQEYVDYFGEETVPFLRGLGLEAQECRNWGPQLDLFKYSAPVRKVPQFVTTFAGYHQPLPNQHPYGVGNDPLEIQFGAIFPQETRNPGAHPAHFHEDSRRILISSGPGNGHSVQNGNHLGRVPGSLEHHVLRWDHRAPAAANGNGQFQTWTTGQPQLPQTSMSLDHHPPDIVIRAAYRQVLGRDVLDGQRQTVPETQLKAGRITLREFVRQLAKSRPFREMYWERLYVTKAIEAIHRRLLGRPTYGRRELNQYYDICAHQGFYALVDTMIDSAEYKSAFGENTLPYERFVTPRGYALRSPHGSGGFKPRENPIIAGEWMQQHPDPPVRSQFPSGAATNVAVMERPSQALATTGASSPQSAQVNTPPGPQSQTVSSQTSYSETGAPSGSGNGEGETGWGSGQSGSASTTSASTTPPQSSTSNNPPY